MTCNLCKTTPKDWQGGDRKCSFPGGSTFDPAGWNCATANAIRDLCGSSHDGFAGKVGQAISERWDDNCTSFIMLRGLELESGFFDGLFVSWYKERGATNAMWLLNGDDPPQKPTEQDCLAIIKSIKGGTPSPSPPLHG